MKPVKVKRAIVSVSDKSGIVDFVKSLVEMGVEIISTGGTARALAEAGLPVVQIDEYTGFPEMMDGRVKTLHPKVHGGLLNMRDNPDHARAKEAHGIKDIDMVVVNLYPFEKTVAKPDVTYEDAIENIDIGGPTMIRSGAKNHAYVAVVTDPADFDAVLREMREQDGALSFETRAGLARKVFALTGKYDGAIVSYLDSVAGK